MGQWHPALPTILKQKLLSWKSGTFAYSTKETRLEKRDQLYNLLTKAIWLFHKNWVSKDFNAFQNRWDVIIATVFVKKHSLLWVMQKLRREWKKVARRDAWGIYSTKGIPSCEIVGVQIVESQTGWCICQQWPSWMFSLLFRQGEPQLVQENVEGRLFGYR